MVFRIILSAVLLAGTAPAQEAAAPALSEDQRLLHILSRLTPGVTPELFAEVRSRGLGPWLEAQLQGGLPEPEALSSRLARLETLALSADQIHEKYQDNPGKKATPQEKKQAKKLAAIPAQDTLQWVLLRAVYSSNPVRETASDFFRNHFSVSVDKKNVKDHVADWERAVIYKHALGNFGELLETTAKHPCMLVYLDNFISRNPPGAAELAKVEAAARKKAGPDADARVQEALTLARQRGLNENYAREIMELHTLGVDNVYTQADVANVARCLTGWTIGRKRETPAFRFDPKMHSPGEKTFLGSVVKEDRSNPVAEGEEVLRILKAHEGTARFLAWKLCRWFVNDEPDAALVDRTAAVFRESGGSIPRVLRAIVEDPAFADPANFRAKFKRPWEFVVSALRVTGAEISKPEALQKALVAMNEPLYRCPAPTGYYDQAEAWRDPGSLAPRWVFANDLAFGKIGGVRIPASLYKDLDPARPESWKAALVARLLPVAGIGETTSRRLDETIRKELDAGPKARVDKVGPLIVSALLGSPEFQKQ